MERITHCKSTHKDMLTKDPNFGIFLDASGRITETYQIDWPRVYSIFDNDDLSDIRNDQLAYEKIRDSWLHTIAFRHAILPYTDAVKWIVDHANPKDRSFFRPKVFTKAYALKTTVQPLNAEFTQYSKTRYNLNEMLKSWMNEPSKFS